ncbi:MAG: regulatory signaling modulator protein AmpE [Gammaproteobacteria bacterium]|nr:regulatory signaling modulator protein AmpE [Gammaproteobacteria bacterium]
MAFLSILIALLVERIFPQFIQFRRFDWLRGYAQWMDDLLHLDRLGGWAGSALLLLPLLLLTWIAEGMFEHTLFGLFELAFNVAVIFFCLGPRDLDNQVEQYLDSIEIGDGQRRFNMAGHITTDEPAMELPEQAVQVSRAMLVQANRRLFAVMFWFTLLGPIAALLYRAMEQYLNRNYLEQSLQLLQPALRSMLGWIDWIPARISLLAYMISGAFEEGLQAYHKGSVSALDSYEQNSDLLKLVGFACITQQEVNDENQAMQLIRKTRGLILRALMVWLLLILLLSFIL